MSDATALHAEGLTKEYGELVALAPLDLKVAEGELVTLVGHNGSGKSTLLNMAAGLLQPTEGSIEIAGHPAGSLTARAATSYLPDTPVLYDDLSVREHIEYIARLHGAEDWERRGDGLMERLGFAHRADDLPSQFSRGLRQKTSIVLALIRPFALLLVDEPFVGLDPAGRDALVELLDEAHHDGAAIVVATHQLDYLARADRCLVLRDGELESDGPPPTGPLT